MKDEADPYRRLGVKRVFNVMGVPTILSANTIPQDIRMAVDSIMQVSVEIGQPQAAACDVISWHTVAVGLRRLGSRRERLGRMASRVAAHRSCRCWLSAHAGQVYNQPLDG